MNQHHKAEGILNTKTPGQQIRMILENGHPLYVYMDVPPRRFRWWPFRNAQGKPVYYLAESGEPMLMISTPGLVHSQRQFLESTRHLRGAGAETVAIKLQSLDELRHCANDVSSDVKGCIFFSPGSISEPIPWSAVFGRTIP